MTEFEGEENTSPIRVKILKDRRSQSPEIRQKLSRSIVEKFSELSKSISLNHKTHVSIFNSMDDEVHLSSLEEHLLKLKAKLSYPRVVSKESHIIEMAQVDVPNPKTAPDFWTKGPFGVMEPSSKCLSVDPAEFDLVFVPGVAFGLNGERIGMGSGFYDRFLIKATKALKIALVYDFQILSEVQQKPWDQRVDWLISELRDIRTPRVKHWFEERGIAS